MKLSFIINFLVICSISANIFSQKGVFSLNLTDVSIKDVLKNIEANSNYRFFYNEDLNDISKKVDIAVREKALSEILDNLLHNSGLTYRLLENNLIVITPESILQQQKVTGAVSDATTGEPIIGANVTIEGTTIGAVTDINGKFTLDIPGSKAVFSVSFIGFNTERIEFSGQSNIDIKLVPDITKLEEVVVVGYGTMKKSDLTGAITSISAKEVAKFPIQRADQALQGRMAGVNVFNTDGAPGGNTIIRIRGTNSINGDNDPLVVIDGFQGGDINKLNPNDIASIEVLKDASATAIYGSKGANGVVLITTKLGTTQRPVISYGYNIGIQKLGKKLDLMNASEYAQTTNDYALGLNGSGKNPQPFFTAQEISDFAKNGGTDWQDEIYQIGILQNHQVSISGGTDKLKYMVSTGYLDHEGVLLNSKYNRISVRTNLEAKLTKWLKYGLNASFIRDKYYSPDFGDQGSFLGQAVNNAPRWSPTVPVYDLNGNYSSHPVGFGPFDTMNPVASALEPDISKPSATYNANMFVELNLADGLTLRIMGGGLNKLSNENAYYNKMTIQGRSGNGSGLISESNFQQLQNTNILTYDKVFGSKHHLTMTGVIEQQKESAKSSRISATQFLLDETGADNIGGAGNVLVGSSAYERALLSYIGRLNYVFNDRYMITATYRADGSSVFGVDNKWAYFPSASIAWRLSEEGFMSEIKQISNFKLRASYGVTGNQGINPYQSLARISAGRNYPWNGLTSSDKGFYIAGLQNRNLRWESTAQSNIGIDLGLFDNRFTATVDYYKKETTDLLMSKELEVFKGITRITDNIGSIENKGLEIVLGGDPFIGDFKWNTSFNLTFNKNKVLDLGGSEKIGYSTTTGGYGLTDFMFLVKGESYGQMLGWIYEGVWKTSEASEAAKYGQLPGAAKYRDLNSDFKIDDKDKTVIGNAMPDYIFGWTNNFSYKNFDLSMLIQGTQGNDLFNTPRIKLEGAYGTSRELLKHWTKTNENTNVPGFPNEKEWEDAKLTNNVFVTSNQTSRWVEDASFVRLKVVTLGYTLPKSKLQKIGLESLRVFASGTNLFTITKYTGYDPEVSSFNDSDAQIGVDFSSYPGSKTLTFGIEITL